MSFSLCSWVSTFCSSSYSSACFNSSELSPSQKPNWRVLASIWISWELIEGIKQSCVDGTSITVLEVSFNVTAVFFPL